MANDNLRRSARVSSLKNNKAAKTTVVTNKSSTAGSRNRNSAPGSLTSIKSAKKTVLDKMKKGNERVKKPTGSERGSNERVKNPTSAKRGSNERVKNPTGSERGSNERVKNPTGSKQGSNEGVKNPTGSKRGSNERVKNPTGSERGSNKRVKNLTGSEPGSNERVKNPTGSDRGNNERVDSNRVWGYLTRSDRDRKELESENVVKEISKTALGKRKSKSQDEEIPSRSVQLKEVSRVSKLRLSGFIGKRRIYTFSSVNRKKEEDKRLGRLMECGNSQSSKVHNVEPVGSEKKLTHSRAYKALFPNQPKKVADQDQSKKLDVHGNSSRADGSSDRTDGDEVMRCEVEYPRTEKEQLPEIKEATNPSLKCVSNSSQLKLDVESNRISKKRKTVCGPVSMKLEQDTSKDNTNQLQGRECSVLDASRTNLDSESQVERNCSSTQNRVASPHVPRIEWTDLRTRVLAFQQEVSELYKTLKLSDPNKDATTDPQEQVSDGSTLCDGNREEQLKVPETNRSNDVPENLAPRGECTITPSISERMPIGDAPTNKLQNHPDQIETSLPCPPAQDAQFITTAELTGHSPTYYCPVNPSISDQQAPIVKPIEKLQSSQPMPFSVNVPSARCASLPGHFHLPSSEPEHHAVSNCCSVQTAQNATQFSVNFRSHDMNPVTSGIPRTAPSTLQDPLQYELTRILKEMDENDKHHEALKMQLIHQFKKEIEEAVQQIRQKYKVKSQAMEVQFVSQSKELDRRFNMVLNHQLLANCSQSFSGNTSSFSGYHMT